MPTTHKNRVQMTVSGTPGTGTITLGSASSGYQSFSSAHGANATVDVLITDGTAWEVARSCTYTHSGTTLGRGTLEASSTGSAISLTSSAVVAQIPTAQWGNWLESAMQGVAPGGRLTLESGVPVSTTGQTAKTTIYYTPYVHDTVALWDGARWAPTTFAETSLALGTLTSGKPYDVFGYLSSGALALELLVWTDDTTRATAATLQDGRYCKSGDKTRLLLGTIYTTSTTTTEDSETSRYVGNAYNAVNRRLFACPAYNNNNAATSYTLNSSTWAELNSGTGNKVNFVAPLATIATAHLNARADAASAGCGIGYDSTSSVTIGSAPPSSSFLHSVRLVQTCAPGRHYFAMLGRNGGGTSTFLADDGRNGSAADPALTFMQAEVRL